MRRASRQQRCKPALIASQGGTILPAAQKAGDLRREINASLDKIICLKVPLGKKKSWRGGVAVQWQSIFCAAGFLFRRMCWQRFGAAGV